MHSCLGVFEILDQIFHYAHYDTSQGKAVNAHDTLALALTCHTFEDAALNILWHTQTNFVQLIKVLPRRYWFETGIDNFSRSFVSALPFILRSEVAQIFHS